MFLRFTLMIGLVVMLVTATSAQCTSLANAVPDLSLQAVSFTGIDSHSGLAFHPGFQQYYSVNAGTVEKPIEIFDVEGNLISEDIAQGFDYRGLWHNPAFNNIEGNGFGSSGLAEQTLDDNTGIPSGDPFVFFDTPNQPDVQSCGDLDLANNYFIYYFSGSVYRKNAATNADVDQFEIQNLPVGLENLNTTSIVYTGCPTQEYAVYDYVNKQVHYINQANGEWTGSTTLPSSAPANNTFAVAFANNRFFLYDRDTKVWNGYLLTQEAVPTKDIAKLEADVLVGPNPTQDIAKLTVSGEAATEALEAIVFDIRGRILLNQQFSVSTELSLAQIPAGNYFVQVRSLESGLVSAAQSLVKQ